jgi:hypothetical protein
VPELPSSSAASCFIFFAGCEGLPTSIRSQAIGIDAVAKHHWRIGRRSRFQDLVSHQLRILCPFDVSVSYCDMLRKFSSSLSLVVSKCLQCYNRAILLSRDWPALNVAPERSCTAAKRWACLTASTIFCAFRFRCNEIDCAQRSCCTCRGFLSVAAHQKPISCSAV